MAENSLSLVLARLDFGWITTLHILYPPLTIGLAAMLFIAEATWLRTDNESWYRLTRFFERLLIINFAAGVATGITMEMAFGILYGPFSQAAGPFFGQVLGYETITAFMYEAGFIGLMIFGWGKISRRMHLFATFNVALSAALSAMWILDAKPRCPTRYRLKSGALSASSARSASGPASRRSSRYRFRAAFSSTLASSRANRSARRRRAGPMAPSTSYSRRC